MILALVRHVHALDPAAAAVLLLLALAIAGAAILRFVGDFRPRPPFS